VRTSTRRLSLPVPDEPVEAVTAVVHTPASVTGPNLLLAPGAGGGLDAAPLVALAEAIVAEGLRVVRVNLPYAEAGRRRSPRADRAVPGFRAIADAAREAVDPTGRWLAGGKSYGGRVASLAAAAGMPTSGLVFYGYPLHPPGKPEQLRVMHWPDIDVPCLFLQGTRDAFGSVELLERHLRKLPRRATVHVVEGGDHSLQMSAAAAPDGRARRAATVVAELGPVVARWARDIEG
jgi:predicted alpha/beta-hydrolase family hydrolase